MSAVFSPLTDVWTLTYTSPDPPPGTLLASKTVSAGDAVVIATAEGIPSSGTYGLRLRNGSETVRLYLGEYLAAEPANSIAVELPVTPITLALVYTNATKLVTGYYSRDGLVWTALEPTVTMAAAPTFGDVFFEQYNTVASVSVAFSNFRVLSGTTVLPYPSTDEIFLPVGAAATSQPPALTATQEAVIHALVGAQFGDLEFDIGKSVRWTQWFADDVFITDVNYGDPRFWIIDWTKSFPYVNYKTSTGRSYFDDPIAFRKRQFADAEQFARDNEDALVFDNNDWVLWVDAHEGLSVDNRAPLPPDYDFDLFRSFVAREIRTAVDAGKDRIIVPFYAFVRHGDLQNVEYDWKPNQAAGGPKAVAACAVPYYIPNQGLVRLMKVSALRNPSFDWSTIDQPSVLAADEGLEAAHLLPTVGTASTPDAGPLPPKSVTIIKATISAGFASSSEYVTAQMQAAGTYGFRYWGFNGTLFGQATADGTNFKPSTLANAAQVAAAGIVPGATVSIAMTTDLDNGAAQTAGQAFVSFNDGVTWNPVAPETKTAGALVSNIDLNIPVTIGAWSTGQSNRWQGRIYSAELRTGLTPAAADNSAQWTPGYINFPPTVTGNIATATVTNAPVDASGSMRLECEQGPFDGQIHSPAQGYFLLYLPYTNGATYFYIWDTVSANWQGSSVTPAQMAAAGVPTTGRWQFKIVWNATTDILSLHGRNPALGLDLMDDSSGWTQIGTISKPGAILRSGTFNMVVGALGAGGVGAGRVWRALTEFNGTLNIDFDFRYLTANPGTTSTLLTGQTCTFTKGATPLVGTPKVDGLVWKFDASEYPGTGTSYVDPRGRTWTLTSAAAIIPYDPPETRLQVISYGYAHWNLQDIPIGGTSPPALSADNDLGWLQRNLLSKVRPITGLPFGATWQFPNADNQGKAGPWAPDTFANQATGVVIPAARPAIDPICAGVCVPLYDNVLRFNTRDGVWYSGDGQGNMPMEWNDNTQTWQPVDNTPVVWDDVNQAWKPVATT